MDCRIIAGLVVMLATARPCLLAQNSTDDAIKYPRIVLKLPDNIASDKVTVWSLLLAQQGKTGPVKPQKNVRQYIIDANVEGQPAHSATLYVYSPGCQFNVYDYALSATSDIEQRFECVPLPTKTVHGFILPAEIPVMI